MSDFYEKEHVYFSSDVHARSIPSLGGSVIIIDKGSHGIVSGINQKGTAGTKEDDFIGVKITEGDEAVEKVVWVPFEEWHNITKT